MTLFAYAEAEVVELRLDGAETQVRRPQTGHPGTPGLRLWQAELSVP
ncbi:hypothetical protein ACF1G5_25480 [Streptomyces coeruleorubidus]